MLGDPDRASCPDARAGRAARRGRSRAGAAGPAAGGAAAAAARASPAAPACGSPAAPSSRRASAATIRVPSVGLAARDLDDRLLDRRRRRPPLRPAAAARRAVDRLAADLQHARHHRGARPAATSSRDRATRIAHSQPRKSSPAISSSYVLRPSARSSSATCRRSSRSPLRSSLPASASRPPSSSLLAPRAVERLGDLVLPAQLRDRAVAAQPGQHDLQLLLRRPTPVLALLARQC